MEAIFSISTPESPEDGISAALSDLEGSFNEGFYHHQRPLFVGL